MCISKRIPLATLSLLFCTDLSVSKVTLLYVAAIIVIINAIVRFLFETSRLITNYNHSSMIFWFYKLVLYTSSIIFTFFFFNKPCACLTFWQWEIGIMATFLAWLNILVLISKFPLVGIYSIMLSRVFLTFLKVALLASLLVIAFGISFFMAFSEPNITVSVECNIMQLHNVYVPSKLHTHSAHRSPHPPDLCSRWSP